MAEALGAEDMHVGLLTVRALQILSNTCEALHPERVFEENLPRVIEILPRNQLY
jgi:hypothetical protein